MTFPPQSGSPEDAPGPASPWPSGDESPPSEPASPKGALGPSDPYAGLPASELPGAVEREESLRRLRKNARKRGDKKAAGRTFWKELPILILVALVVAVLIKTFLVQAFFIPSGSMHDTLLEGDRVMVNKLAYRLGHLARGDVVVFDNPQAADADGESIFGALVRHVAESLGLSSPDSALIKRVIALGGETIEIRQNQVYIDGVAIDEPYVKEGSRMPPYGPFTVPEGYVFVMGDNRSQSSDSRVFGPIPEGSIVGKAFVRVWPPSRWGGL